MFIETERPLCPEGNLPESVLTPLAAPSPTEYPHVSPCLKARANPHGSTSGFLVDGAIKSKHIDPSGQEGQVAAVLPHTFSFFILRAWYIL